MRKTIIAAIVASALFAVGAFAAEFTVDAEDIASGAGDVDRCASNVLVQFGALAPPTGSGTDWTVTTATATFHNGTATTPTPGCDGFTADLALLFEDGTAFSNIDTEVVGDSVALGVGRVEFTFAAQDVGVISGASVAVDGVELDADFIEP